MFPNIANSKNYVCNIWIFLYIYIMNIMEFLTGKLHNAVILPVKNSDYKLITKSRYFFNWKAENNQEVYKLVIKDSVDILGIISFERIPDEWRIHIRLLSVSKENAGKEKKYDKIAGNLIVYVAKIALVEFGELACISLKPKSKIAEHYIEKYKMNITGMTLSLEIPELIDLINEYEN